MTYINKGVWLSRDGKRRCSSCKVVMDLTVDNFYRNTAASTGFKYVCKLCVKDKALHRERVIRIRNELFGNKSCVCCNESNIGFLTIDHKNNDGNKDRKINKQIGGYNFYATLLKEKVFRSNLQILCWNCNLGRQISGDKICPHKKEPQ